MARHGADGRRGAVSGAALDALIDVGGRDAPVFRSALVAADTILVPMVMILLVLLCQRRPQRSCRCRIIILLLCSSGIVHHFYI